MINRIKRSVQPIALAGWLVFVMIALKWLWGCGTEWPWPVDPSGDTVTYEVVSIFEKPLHGLQSYYPKTITLSLTSAKNNGSPWIGQVQFRSGEWLPITDDGGPGFRVDTRGVIFEEIDFSLYGITFSRLKVTRSEITGMFYHSGFDYNPSPTFRAIAVHRGPR